MGANLKFNPQFISFLAFIGLYLTTPLVKADLPNKDVMKAAACMRKVFTDVITSFRNDGITLTKGEFFGIMCNQVSEDAFCDVIAQNDIDEDFNGSSIKACLENTGDGDLFQKYVKLGQTLASPSADETLKQDDVPPTQSESQQISPPLQNLELDSELTDGKSRINDDSEESEDDISRPTSPQNSKLNSPVLYFKRGACQSGIAQGLVEFTDLKNEQDKKDTIQCLRGCASNFLSRITILLDQAKDEVINSSILGLNEEEKDILNDLPESSKKFTKDKFDTELNKAIETNPLSTNPIEEIGKKYLITYDELYSNVIKHKKVGLNKTRHRNLGYLDVNLIGAREMYQICAQLECSMTTNSIPLLIQFNGIWNPR
ncbi:uncharacterized protein LOC135833961 [Planococcus citri]|uniref:uncharacterized protein LOC135833961 n=1 Tax=Planococcus citri TaxID=170843 RepID=UPI0031F955E8